MKPDSVPAALTWSLEVGGSHSTPFVEDGNGVSMRAGIGPYLRLGASREISGPFRATAGVRGDAAGLRARSGERTWRPGATRRIDVHAGVELDVTTRVTALATALVGRATGPDDVIPFRAHGGTVWLPGAEAGLMVAADRRRRMAIAIAVEASRMRGQSSESPRLDGGTIGRVRLGLRHAFR